MVAVASSLVLSCGSEILGYASAVLRMSRRSSCGIGLSCAGVGCWSAVWSVLRGDLTGGGDGGVGASVLVDGTSTT